MRRILLTLSILTLLLFQRLPIQAQWKRQNSETDADFRGVSAVSARVAWVSGSKGTVLRTLNSGTSWEKVGVPEAESLDFRDIQAFDANVAYVMSAGPGALSRIYKTTDGGKSWHLQFRNANAKAFYDGFAFWDSANGIAMSDSIGGVFPLLVTSDGEAWKPLNSKRIPPALPNEGGFAASGTNISVNGKNDVWFATGGVKARVFRSADRGKRWNVVDSPLLGGTPRGIFSVAFQNRRNGVIVGGDYEKPTRSDKTAAYSRDGGKTWRLSAKMPSGFRSAVAYLPGASSVWVAVGTNGSDFSRDGGVTWHSLDKGNYNALSFYDSSAGWAVGPHGVISRFVGLPKR